MERSIRMIMPIIRGHASMNRMRYRHTHTHAHTQPAREQRLHDLLSGPTGIDWGSQPAPRNTWVCSLHLVVWVNVCLFVCVCMWMEKEGKGKERGWMGKQGQFGSGLVWWPDGDEIIVAPVALWLNSTQDEKNGDGLLRPAWPPSSSLSLSSNAHTHLYMASFMPPIQIIHSTSAPLWLSASGVCKNAVDSWTEREWPDLQIHTHTTFIHEKTFDQ